MTASRRSPIAPGRRHTSSEACPSVSERRAFCAWIGLAHRELRPRRRRRATDKPSAHQFSDGGEWRGGISPPRSLRTGRDTLVSSGSHCSAASIEQAPMCEQPRLMACDARQPVSGSPLAPAQGLKLSGGPSRQDKVDVLQGRIEGRRTEPPIVVDPTANVRVEHPREVIQGFVTAPMHRPTPDSPTDRRERRCAGGGTERDAHTPGPFAHHPWPESVAEKVELKS